MRKFVPRNWKLTSGFTLIELMITVAIVAVLAAIVYPSYINQVQKSNRAQAKTRLVQAAQLFERFYSDNNTYCMDYTGTPAKLVVAACPSTVAGFAALMNVPSGTTVYSGSNNETNSPYIISIAAAPAQTANSYTLQAVPQGAQTNDAKCGTITLNNVGVKGFSGSGAMRDCW